MPDRTDYLGNRPADEIYRRLQEGYNSRGRELRFFGAVSTLLVLWLTREDSWSDQFAFVALLWTLVIAFRTFIENSHLNHLMQQIEWLQANR